MQTQLSPISTISPKDYNKQETQTVPTTEQVTNKTIQNIKTDTIAISPQAIKMSAGNLEWVRLPPWKIQYKNNFTK
jgi:hypothetical protein